MTMLEERPTKLIPLPDAIAALDRPEAIAGRKKRAHDMAKKLVGDARNAMIQTASRHEIQKAAEPIYRAANTRDISSDRRVSMPQAEKEAGRNFDALMPRLCEDSLRRSDEAALYADPDRLEEQRCWNLYCTQVSAAAWRQGNQSAAWIARWREMIAARQDAESFGDSTAAIDDRLMRLVGAPYPVAPAASWEAAPLIPVATERVAEIDRLAAKYPGTDPRTPAADEAPKRRGRK